MAAEYKFVSKEPTGAAALEALHKPPAHHYTAGQEKALEEERIRNTNALHYPWEKSWHSRQFIGPLSEHGMLGYIVPSFRYSYYSTADGQDCHLKALWWLKYGSLAGFSWAVFYGAGNVSARYETKIQKMMRYTKCVGTPALAGLTYASFSCMFTQVRGEDDPINTGLAGALAGGVVGACIRSAGWGSTWALVFGLTGMLVKYIERHPELHVLPNRPITRDRRVIWGYEKRRSSSLQEIENRPSFNAIRPT